jgi:2'-5' RNA ligase
MHERLIPHGPGIAWIILRIINTVNGQQIKMESFTQSLPGYRFNEYMLVLSPHEELRKKIGQVKKEFAETYKCPQALWGKPHMILARFTQYEMMEERILHRMKSIAMGFYPVKIELKDYGSSPSHSIFIKVASREPIRDLIREIRETQRLLKPDSEHKPYFTDDPHILIVNKLTPWQYESGWQAFAQRHFTGRFIAESMLLLKRRPGEKSWQIVEGLAFQNLPVAIKQGDLFG